MPNEEDVERRDGVDSAEGGGEELDFTKTEPPPPNKLAPPPQDKPFDPEPQREKMRARLAGSLIVLVAVLSILTYVFLAAGWINGDDIQRLDAVFAALVTLTGTAVGFYFGGGKGGSR